MLKAATKFRDYDFSFGGRKSNLHKFRTGPSNLDHDTLSPPIENHQKYPDNHRRSDHYFFYFFQNILFHFLYSFCFFYLLRRKDDGQGPHAPDDQNEHRQGNDVHIGQRVFV